MIEAYSSNIEVATDSAIPLNITSLQSGCDTCKNGAATIQLTKRGTYRIEVDASVSAAEAGAVEIQLNRNGVLQPQARSVVTITTPTTEIQTLGFDTFVVVECDYNPCSCSSVPVTVFISNVGIGATFEHINCTIQKIC